MERKKDESRGSANDGSGRRRRRVRAQRMKKCCEIKQRLCLGGTPLSGERSGRKRVRVRLFARLRTFSLALGGAVGKERGGNVSTCRSKGGAALARREKSPTLEIGNFEKREEVLRPRGSRGRRRRKGTGSNSRVVVTHPIFLPALDFRNFSTCGWRERGVMGVSARLKIVAVRWNNCKRTGLEGV